MRSELIYQKSRTYFRTSLLSLSSVCTMLHPMVPKYKSGKHMSRCISLLVKKRKEKRSLFRFIAVFLTLQFPLPCFSSVQFVSWVFLFILRLVSSRADLTSLAATLLGGRWMERSGRTQTSSLPLIKKSGGSRSTRGDRLRFVFLRLKNLFR